MRQYVKEENEYNETRDKQKKTKNKNEIEITLKKASNNNNKKILFENKKQTHAIKKH